jgi:hypothetical protein
MSSDPEQRLEAVRRRLGQMAGADSRIWREAFDELRRAERELAAARGEQYAVPIDLGVQWDTGAPLPHVIANGADTYIVCHANVPDPDWDGTYVEMVSPADVESSALIAIELRGCAELRLGGPNDEALRGHPLSGRGLEGYEAHEVYNSDWIEQAIKVNSVHPHHSDDYFRGLRHYALLFHDEMVEALADSISATLVQGTMRAVMTDILDRITQ